MAIDLRVLGCCLMIVNCESLYNSLHYFFQKVLIFIANQYFRATKLNDDLFKQEVSCSFSIICCYCLGLSLFGQIFCGYNGIFFYY